MSTPEKMRAALLAAEPVLADVERLLNKRFHGTQPLVLHPLQQVRDALSLPKCPEPQCAYHEQFAPSSCRCVK